MYLCACCFCSGVPAFGGDRTDQGAQGLAVQGQVWAPPQEVRSWAWRPLRVAAGARGRCGTVACRGRQHGSPAEHACAPVTRQPGSTKKRAGAATSGPGCRPRGSVSEVRLQAAAARTGGPIDRKCSPRCWRTRGARSGARPSGRGVSRVCCEGKPGAARSSRNICKAIHGRCRRHCTWTGERATAL